MTTETTEPTISEKLASAKSELATLITARDTAQNAFSKLLASGGKDMTIEEQLKVSSDALAANAKVQSAEANVAKLEKSVKIEALDKPVTTFRDAVRDAFTKSGLMDAMKASEVGTALSLGVSFAEDGTITVSSKFAGVANIVTSAERRSGTRSKLSFNDGTRDYTSAQYVEAYFDAAKSAGYKSSRATWQDVPHNEYAKIAPIIAEKLGHTNNSDSAE
jgi:hypothetical protein